MNQKISPAVVVVIIAIVVLVAGFFLMKAGKGGGSEKKIEDMIANTVAGKGGAMGPGGKANPKLPGAAPVAPVTK